MRSVIEGLAFACCNVADGDEVSVSNQQWYDAKVRLHLRKEHRSSGDFFLMEHLIPEAPVTGHWSATTSTSNKSARRTITYVLGRTSSREPQYGLSSSPSYNIPHTHRYT